MHQCALCNPNNDNHINDIYIYIFFDDSEIKFFSVPGVIMKQNSEIYSIYS